MKERLESVEEQARKDALDEVRAAVQPTRPVTSGYLVHGS